jgi:hypothetical protein
VGERRLALRGVDYPADVPGLAPVPAEPGVGERATARVVADDEPHLLAVGVEHPVHGPGRTQFGVDGIGIADEVPTELPQIDNRPC